MSAWFSNDTVCSTAAVRCPSTCPSPPPSLRRLGVSHAQLRRLVARGLVRRVCRGVYAVTQAPDDLAFRARALGLVVSPSAVVTDRTAAWLHGVGHPAAERTRTMPPVSVFQRPGRAAAATGSPAASGCSAARRRRGRRSGRDLAAPDGTGPRSASCGASTRLGPLDQFLRIGVDPTSCDGGRAVQGLPRRRAARGSGAARGPARRVAGGVRAAPALVRRRLAEAGTPVVGVRRVRHALFRLDLALPEVLFAAEYDGTEFHLRP